MYRLFSWRIASHVPPWDWEQIRSEVDTWEEWLPTWVRWAERHVALGDEALAQGRQLTAGEACVRAGLFYHWGTFVSVEDSAAFRNALEAADRAWAKAAPLVEPPFELVDIPFEGRCCRATCVNLPAQSAHRSWCYCRVPTRPRRSSTARRSTCSGAASPRSPSTGPDMVSSAFASSFGRTRKLPCPRCSIIC